METLLDTATTLTAINTSIDTSAAPDAGGRCPLCSSSELTRLVENDGKSLNRCGRCRVCFVEPRPSLENLSAYFSGSYVMSEELLDTKFQLGRHAVLSSVACSIHSRKNGGTILDVGCAIGYFLGRFFHPPVWELWGVEPSVHAAARAVARGIRTHVGNLRAAHLASEYFDFVTVLDAFYYFPDPRRELEEIRRVLKPGGRLVLELPLAAARLFRTTTGLGRWLGGASQPLLQSSDHLFYYGPRSVAFLLEESGFRIEEIRPLAGNRPQWLSRRMLYSAYSVVSASLWNLSGSRLALSPRFLTVATPR